MYIGVFWRHRNPIRSKNSLKKYARNKIRDWNLLTNTVWLYTCASGRIRWQWNTLVKWVGLSASELIYQSLRYTYVLWNHTSFFVRNNFMYFYFYFQSNPSLKLRTLIEMQYCSTWKTFVVSVQNVFKNILILKFIFIHCRLSVVDGNINSEVQKKLYKVYTFLAYKYHHRTIFPTF